MSMTFAAAKKYIAGIIGGQNNPQIIDAAEEALYRTYEDWEVIRNWSFLLKDTSLGFTVDNCTNATGTTLTPPTVGAFDAVNPTIVVTGTGVSEGTTISSVVRNANTGHITSIVTSGSVSEALTGRTLTFSADIPLITTTPQVNYSAPTDFRTADHARLLTTKTVVDYIEDRLWNKLHPDTLAATGVTQYTVNYHSKVLRVFGIPKTTELLRLQYYRCFNKTADPIDIPDTHLYRFLDYAQWRLLEKKNAHDDRLPQIATMAEKTLTQCVLEDTEQPQGNSLPRGPLSVALAKVYIASILQGQTDPLTLAAAEEALLRAYEDWEGMANWSFLLTDTTNGFSIPLCVTTTNSTTILPPFANSFDGINIGVTVSGTGNVVTPTVATVVRTGGGHVTSITLSAVVTTGVPAGVTLTFGGNIPLAHERTAYSVPYNFRRAHTAKIVSTAAPLDYTEYRLWGTLHPTIPADAVPTQYTVVLATKELLLSPPVNTALTLYLQYYRSFDRTSLTVDIPESHLYRFLDYAQWKFLEKNGREDPRLPQIAATMSEICLRAIQENIESSQGNSYPQLPLTRSLAKKYVASILSNPDNPQILLAAEEAILRAYEDWQRAALWSFLLKDTAAEDDIEIVVGTDLYDAPTDFYSPYHAQLIEENRPLDFIEYRLWHKMTVGGTTTGPVIAYTTYNPDGPLAVGTGAGESTTQIKLFPIPSTTGTIRLQYYRNFDRTGTVIDIPAELLYNFLDYAQWLLLLKKSTDDARLSQIGRIAQISLATAVADNAEPTQEQEPYLVSQIEQFGFSEEW